MAELRVGDHPVPLDEVHELMGEEGLLQHLGVEHETPVDRRLGPMMHKAVHRVLHGQPAW